jgi:2,4-didehydro-3-deoxy-L-rhamnonate hydrolase
VRIGRLTSGELVVIRDGNCYDASGALAVLAPQAWPYPKGDQLIAQLDTIVAAIEGGPTLREIGPADAASFASLVANPTKVVGAPVNYESHVDEAQSNLAAFPHAVARIQQAGLFLKAASSLVGPGDGIALRFPDRRTDHELELGVVIGRTADRVSVASALDYVAGYAIALDMTPRGKEDRSFRKSVDSYGVLGPWLVTADEIADPNALAIELFVNGERRQQSNTRHLIMNVQELIAWASEYYTLYPGDVIMTGTPSGVGPVEPGDSIVATIERIGTMRVRASAIAPAIEPATVRI